VETKGVPAIDCLRANLQGVIDGTIRDAAEVRKILREARAVKKELAEVCRLELLAGNAFAEGWGSHSDAG